MPARAQLGAMRTPGSDGPLSARSQRCGRGRALWVSWLCFALSLTGACSTPSDPAGIEEAPPDALPATAERVPVAPTQANDPTEPGSRFLGTRAEAHERALSQWAPRDPGSASATAARAYLVEHFEDAGARVYEVMDRERRHLVAELSGVSRDALVIVAPWTLPGPDDWVGDSSAAQLLELARVKGQTKPAYTLRFILAETRFPTWPDSGAASGQQAHRIETPRGARRLVVEAGESLARALVRLPVSGSVRGIVVLDAPARPALRFARDLRSLPSFRAAFWNAASRLGYRELFPPEAGWSSPESLHLGLGSLAEGRIIALVDESWSRPEEAALPNPDRSLEVHDRAGRVLAAALEDWMQRLARIDAFGSPEVGPPAALVRPAAGRPQLVPHFAESPPSS